MKPILHRMLTSPPAGLTLVILLLGTILTLFAGTHLDRRTGVEVNNFLNSNTLIQTATDASFFAVMAVGATFVIISGGIDLSVGSVYALAGVTMALALRALGPRSDATTVILALLISLLIGVVCGLINGVMVIGLPVHPFVITLGTMWILRGLAFVVSHAESILVPGALTQTVKATLGFAESLYPVPMLVMILVAVLGALYLEGTVMGRHIFALGGNPEASLTGGKGSAISAMLGALLIVLIRQSIRTLRLDQNYEWIVIGAAIIIAVVLDQGGARMAARRLSPLQTGGTAS